MSMDPNHFQICEDKVSAAYALRREDIQPVGYNLLTGQSLHGSSVPQCTQYRQVFWSNSYGPILDYSTTFGWPSRLAFLCAWSFSCNLLRSQAADVRLVSDNDGLALACRLRLPYSRMDAGLQSLNATDKLAAYPSSFARLVAMSTPTGVPTTYIDLNVLPLSFEWEDLISPNKSIPKVYSVISTSYFLVKAFKLTKPEADFILALQSLRDAGTKLPDNLSYTDLANYFVQDPIVVIPNEAAELWALACRKTYMFLAQIKFPANVTAVLSTALPFALALKASASPDYRPFRFAPFSTSNTAKYSSHGLVIYNYPAHARAYVKDMILRFSSRFPDAYKACLAEAGGETSLDEI